MTITQINKQIASLCSQWPYYAKASQGRQKVRRNVAPLYRAQWIEPLQLARL